MKRKGGRAERQEPDPQTHATVKEEKGMDMATDGVVDDVYEEHRDSHRRLWWGAHEMRYPQTLARREVDQPNRSHTRARRTDIVQKLHFATEGGTQEGGGSPDANMVRCFALKPQRAQMHGDPGFHKQESIIL